MTPASIVLAGLDDHLNRIVISRFLFWPCSYPGLARTGNFQGCYLPVERVGAKITRSKDFFGVTVSRGFLLWLELGFGELCPSNAVG